MEGIDSNKKSPSTDRNGIGVRVVAVTLVSLARAGLAIGWSVFRGQASWASISALSPKRVFSALRLGICQVLARIRAHPGEVVLVLMLVALVGYVWVITPRGLAAPPVFEPVTSLLVNQLGRVPIWAWVGFAASIIGMAAILGIRGYRGITRENTLRLGVLLGNVALALAGELLLMANRLTVGAIVFGFGFVGFARWLVVHRPEPVGKPEVARFDRKESVLLVLVLGLTIFARFYDLAQTRYGVEGDESKWVIEVVSVMVDGEHTSEYGRMSPYHYSKLPVSFYMQAPFHHLLGPSVLTARIAVATYSVLATLAFYWLVRHTLGRRVALLSGALLAVSLVDVSASRYALVEAHVKIWGVTGLAFLAHGLRMRRPFYSFVGGLALAIGLLTYDTFLPMVGVALLWGIVSLASRRARPREWVVQLMALLVPVLIVAPAVYGYLVSRVAYYNNNPAHLNLKAPSMELIWSNARNMLQNFWDQPVADFLFVRDGPVVNHLLVPLLGLGFVLAAARSRRPGYVLPALWFVLLFFPVPIYSGNPAVRIFYPGFPAVYVLVALSLVSLWREANALVPASLRTVFATMGGIALTTFLVWNFFLYLNDVEDPRDRRIRREIGEMVAEAATPGRRVYVPYFLDSQDVVEIEQGHFRLEARRKLDRDQVAELIWSDRYEDFLPTALRDSTDYDSQAFVFNHFLVPIRDLERRQVMETLQRCLDLRRERDGQWFDLYVTEASGPVESRCTSPRLRLESPDGSFLQPGERVQLRWGTENGATLGPAELAWECQQVRSDTVVVEAEDMAYEETWHEDQRYVIGFRGRGYLADKMQRGKAQINVTLPITDTYTLWVRLYRRTADPYPLYLSVDEQRHTLSYTLGDTLKQWVWLQGGQYSLDAGRHAVEISRGIEEPESGTLALFVDTLLFSADAGFDPAVESEWISSGGRHVEDVPVGVRSGTFEHVAGPVGQYRCWVTAGDGERLVDWNGEPGIPSNPVWFEVSMERPEEPPE